MSKHTPEPWHLAPNDGGARLVMGRSARGDVREIARVLYHNGSEDPEIQPNARLIAACPEMLGAVLLAMEIIMRYPEAVGGNQTAITQIRALLSRIDGAE